MATIEREFLGTLPGWQPQSNGIGRTFHFDDFRAATRFVGRIADDAAASGRPLTVDIRDDRVTVTVALWDGSTLTPDDVLVARRIQRLVGDHRHPVGRAGPWSPRGPVIGLRPRPAGQAGP
jgi:pterin-4a-carbinolamine dehydratase